MATFDTAAFDTSSFDAGSAGVFVQGAFDSSTFDLSFDTGSGAPDTLDATLTLIAQAVGAYSAQTKYGYAQHWPSCSVAMRFNGNFNNEAGSPGVPSAGATISADWFESGTTSLRLEEVGGWDMPTVTIPLGGGVAAGALTVAATFFLSQFEGGVVMPFDTVDNPTNSKLRFYAQNFTVGATHAELRVEAQHTNIQMGVDEYLNLILPNAIPIGVPCRVMVTKDSNSLWHVMVDGIQIATWQDVPGRTITLGDDAYAQYSGQGTPGLNYIDELYFVNGVALETGDYSPLPIFPAQGLIPTDISVTMSALLELVAEVDAYSLAGEMDAPLASLIAEVVGAVPVTGPLASTLLLYGVITGEVARVGQAEAGFSIQFGAQGVRGNGGEMDALLRIAPDYVPVKVREYRSHA